MHHCRIFVAATVVFYIPEQSLACIPGCPGAHHVTQTGFKLQLFFLPRIPECWGCNRAPPPYSPYTLHKQKWIYSHTDTSKLLLLSSCIHRKLRRGEDTSGRLTKGSPNCCTSCPLCSTNVSSDTACSKVPFCLSSWICDVRLWENHENTRDTASLFILWSLEKYRESRFLTFYEALDNPRVLGEILFHSEVYYQIYHQVYYQE